MDSFNGSGPVYLLVGIAILVVVFLICREIVCWYFKYTAMVRELEAIRIVSIDQLKTQQLTNAALYETNQLLRRVAGVPPLETPIAPAL
jgi:hypothetical protein